MIRRGLSKRCSRSKEVVLFQTRHCEERSDEAIQLLTAVIFLDGFASLAMTPECRAQ
jgi:hypothetical protein